MEGVIEISAFMDYLEKHDRVIAPRKLVAQSMELEKLQKECLKQKMLSFREICDAELWGRNLQQNSAKVYAKKYAKEGEIIEVMHGERPVLKITIGAVERIAKIRKTWHSIAK